MPEDKVKTILQDVPGVKEVHDLHVWTHGRGEEYRVGSPDRGGCISREGMIRVKHDAVDRLKDIGIDHLTVEIEYESEGCYSCPAE